MKDFSSKSFIKNSIKIFSKTPFIYQLPKQQTYFSAFILRINFIILLTLIFYIHFNIIKKINTYYLKFKDFKICIVTYITHHLQSSIAFSLGNRLNYTLRLFNVCLFWNIWFIYSIEHFQLFFLHIFKWLLQVLFKHY